jgi:hypothetical protein
METEQLRGECGGSLTAIELYKKHPWPVVLEDEQSLL